MATAATHTPPTAFAAAALERRQREQDYTLFKKLAQSFFKNPPFDPKHLRMQARARYSMVMAEDGRTVEIYYGDREVENLQRLSHERLRREWDAATETGAALLYSQGDDSVVSVFLYPAKTESMKAEEDAILLARYRNLELLTGRGTLEKHWRAFRAYAEETSLDGEPSLREGLLVRWLRFARPSVRDGRRAPAPALAATEQLLRFAAAVALGVLAISAVA